MNSHLINSHKRQLLMLFRLCLLDSVHTAKHTKMHRIITQIDVLTPFANLIPTQSTHLICLHVNLCLYRTPIHCCIY